MIVDTVLVFCIVERTTSACAWEPRIATYIVLPSVKKKSNVFTNCSVCRKCNFWIPNENRQRVLLRKKKKPKWFLWNATDYLSVSLSRENSSALKFPEMPIIKVTERKLFHSFSKVNAKSGWWLAKRKLIVIGFIPFLLRKLPVDFITACKMLPNKHSYLVQ